MKVDTIIIMKMGVVEEIHNILDVETAEAHFSSICENLGVDDHDGDVHLVNEDLADDGIEIIWHTEVKVNTHINFPEWDDVEGDKEWLQNKLESFDFPTDYVTKWIVENYISDDGNVETNYYKFVKDHIEQIY